MDNISGGPIREQGRASRHRIRQEGSSSELSYIEPPPMKHITKYSKHSYGDRPDHHRHHSRKPVERSISVSNSSSQTSEKFQVQTGSFSHAKPAKIYERRPRHKTKEDRYELKEKKKQTKDSLPTAEPLRKKRKKKSKVKRRESYEHNFTAQNVNSDRLTVSSSHEAGAIQRKLNLVDQTGIKHRCIQKRTCLISSSSKRMLVSL